MRVFISHSFQDRAKYDDVRFNFEAYKIPNWDPGEVSAGLPLRDQLADAIAHCEVCVYIATRNSLESAWCQAEIGAFWGARKPVVVYLVDAELAESDLPC